MNAQGKFIAGLVISACAATLMPIFGYADTSLSVTVTPPLFQLTISPGQSWSSALKVVNANSYDVTYYAQPMDFSAEGESGQASFAPVVNVPTDGTADSYSLARWIQISPEPVVIPSGRSANIPFTVSIPQGAEPGGHYAAILVGTQPPQIKTSGPSMKISSYVSSLLFVKVEGNIQENARVREFRTDQSLYQTPDAKFLIRFENLGNTHLKPEGIITIYNMWGKKRGELLINQEKNFGNVLPKTIRKFEFSWSGGSSLLDIGKYSAVVTLNFGDKNKQNISATTYFWVVPMIPVAATIFSIVIFMLLLVWFIRRYIRRALAIESGRQFKTPAVIHSQSVVSEVKVAPAQVEAYTIKALIEPLKEGVIDLRRITSVASASPMSIQDAAIPANRVLAEKNISLLQFIGDYRAFFLFVIALIGAGVGVYAFFSKVLIPEGAYEIKQVSTQVETVN